MNLVTGQYVEVSAIGVFVLLSILVYIVIVQHDYHSADMKEFKNMLICNIVLIVVDVVTYLLRWKNDTVYININHVMCVIFFSLHTVFGYFWLMYCIRRLFPEKVLSLKARIITKIPIVISFVLVLASVKTGWVYKISKFNIYNRGDFVWIPTVFMILYWIASSIIIIKDTSQQDKARERVVYIIMLLFPVPTLIGNLLQMRFFGMTIVWICSALSLQMIFVNMQNNQLSRDMLTGLYNRRRTNQQIEWELSKLNDAKYKLFFIMIDVDKFKKINDEFGHLVGDQALIDVSNILRRSFKKRDFIGRFGGDEFIVIGRVKTESDINMLLDKMNTVIEEENKKDKEYKLSLSAGFKIYGKGEKVTIDDVISAADKEMYEIKKIHH